MTTETSGKTQCVDARCYADAWDVADSETMSTSASALVVATPYGTILDAVPFVTSTPSGVSFIASINTLQAGGQWMPATCGGGACDTAAEVDAIGVDWSGTDTTIAGESMQRDDVDTNAADDWWQDLSTWGAANL